MFAYLRMDDEVRINAITQAIIKAFKVDPKPNTLDGEEVIDTTKPEFIEKFKGFTGTPGGRR